MNPVCVGIIGAAGETGGSIVDGLLEAGGFGIVALSRPSSLTKPANEALAARGVTLRAFDTAGTQEDLVTALKDIDVLISAIAPLEQLAQIPVATAAKTAGVKRFIPCGFVPVIPAGGVHLLRDVKEEVYNHVKQLRLPYTILDVGWWYQISFPRLPSGRIDYASTIPSNTIPGDGNVPNALVDLKDVGRYVARIIVDDRTLNRMVFVYDEVWTTNKEYDLLEKLSGEKLERHYASEDELKARIAQVDALVGTTADAYGVTGKPDAVVNWGNLLQKIGNQYLLSWGVHGHNSPEYAKYLGYLTSEDLYPDFKPLGLEDYLKTLLSGKAKAPYQERKVEFGKAVAKAGLEVKV